MVLKNSFMVASKNIRPGEIIFKDKALITGPKQGCLPCCLTCYETLINVDHLFRCPGCHFPFCQEKCAKVISKFTWNNFIIQLNCDCQSSNHEAECLVLKRAEIYIDDVTEFHPIYLCILPLRGLLLKSTQPKLFQVT